MNKEFIDALDELEKDKGIPKEQLLDALQRALVSAYKGRNKNTEENVTAEINPDTGEIQILHYKSVVEEVENPSNEVSLDEMLQYDASYEVGDVAVFPVPVEGLGRIAAQTAKQVVFQTVRDIERDMVYDEYIGKLNELITGSVQRVSNETVFVSIGRTDGLMPPGEQVRGERYSVNSRMKFYITDVRKSQKGPQVFLSRSHPGLVRRLFELEVPEIQDGIITIESIAREAGSRTKIAVISSDDSVDPVGACVGNRGARVQAIVDELFGEKIDIIPWTGDLEDNIMNSLSPSKVEKVILGEVENTALAVVPDYQLSLAIGKEGQNVRLAAKLTGIKIDIKSHTQYYETLSEVSTLTASLDEDGYLNVEDFINASDKSPDEEAAEGDGIEETVLADADAELDAVDADTDTVDMETDVLDAETDAVDADTADEDALPEVAESATEPQDDED